MDLSLFIFTSRSFLLHVGWWPSPNVSANLLITFTCLAEDGQFQLMPGKGTAALESQTFTPLFCKVMGIGEGTTERFCVFGVLWGSLFHQLESEAGQKRPSAGAETGSVSKAEARSALECSRVLLGICNEICKRAALINLLILKNHSMQAGACQPKSRAYTILPVLAK